MPYLKDKYTQQFIRDNNLIMAEVVIGSYAFNLHTPKSDRDVYGLYHLTKEDFYSLHYRADQSYNDVVEKANPKDQDITYMEIGKFMELLSNGNPNVLEMLASFKDMSNVIYWNDTIANIDMNKIISKKCHKSFGDYASNQIKKARGLNKKIVNPVAVERKTPLDFCYTMIDGKTHNMKTHIEKLGLNQKFFGVVALTNAKDCYALYYDKLAQRLFTEYPTEEQRNNIEIERLDRREKGLSMGFGFKGIELENSNEIRLSSVPKFEKVYGGHPWDSDRIYFMGYMSYNKDGYIQHCKDYKEYWEWDEKKNPERFENNLKQNYDTKNISHCVRLLSVAKEIAEGKGIILKRTEDRQFLMDIKLGKVEYDMAMSYAENIANSLEDLYKNSTLRDEPDFNYLNDYLIDIRKKLYDEQTVSNPVL